MKISAKLVAGLAGVASVLLCCASARAEDPLVRAGCPNQIAWYARPGYGDKYIVYYLGGGAKPWRGEGRFINEGTFGVDYMPIVPGYHQSVALGWWHGRRYQGGTGQYEPNFLVRALPNASIGNPNLR